MEVLLGQIGVALLTSRVTELDLKVFTIDAYLELKSVIVAHSGNSRVLILYFTFYESA